MYSEEFSKEFEEAQTYQKEIPEYALYIAGAARRASSVSLPVICQFLKRLYTSAKEGSLSESSLLNIENAVYAGKFGTAHKILKNSLSRSCAKCSGNINENASTLEGCWHLYHTECLKKMIKNHLEKAQTEIKCAKKECSGKASEYDIRHLDHDLSRELDNIELHRLIASGTLGQLISCPLCREKFIVDGSQKVECFYCRIRICTSCNRTVANCACNK